MELIDIHTHILPGLDDGAHNFEEGIALLQAAHDHGTGTVVFTPHYRGKYRQHAPEMLQSRFREFSGEVRKILPDMRLYLGQELYFDAQISERLADGQVLSLNHTRYAMLEFSPRATADQVVKGIDGFLYYGYVPVIAHVERCQVFRRNAALLEYAVERSALLQVNADSVLGGNGWELKRFCHKILKKQIVDFIASDAHDPVRRPPFLRDCFWHVYDRYGEEYARRIFCENPSAMLADEDI